MIDTSTQYPSATLHAGLASHASRGLDGARPLRWRARTGIGFRLCWLRESARRALGGEFGTKIDGPPEVEVEMVLDGGFTRVVSIEADGRLRLRCFAAGGSRPRLRATARYRAMPAEPRNLRAALLGLSDLREPFEQWVAGETPFEALRAPAKARFLKLFGRRCEWGPFQVSQALNAVDRLGWSIYDQALAAIEKKFSFELGAGLASRCPEEPFLDYTYDATLEAYELCRQAMAREPIGPFAGPAGEIRLDGLELCRLQPMVIDLQMPFLTWDDSQHLIELIPRMQVAVDDLGKLFVRGPGETAESNQGALSQAGLVLASASLGSKGELAGFGLTFTSLQKLSFPQARYALPPVLQACGFDEKPVKWLEELAPNPAEVEAGITLRVPASMAPAWSGVPRERTVAFRQVLQRMSVRVQAALRTWIPYVYFSDLERYAEFETADSLLVYQASRPFSRRQTGEFTYDPLNPECVDAALRSAAGPLAQTLEPVERLLRESGPETLSRHYAPSRARAITEGVKRAPRSFKSLLAADTFLVAEMLKLAVETPRLGTYAGCTERATHRLASRYVEAVQWKLKRLYGGLDCHSFASLLLLEATLGVASAMGIASPVRVALRLRAAGDGPTTEALFVTSPPVSSA